MQVIKLLESRNILLMKRVVVKERKNLNDSNNLEHIEISNITNRSHRYTPHKRSGRITAGSWPGSHLDLSPQNGPQVKIRARF